MKKMFYIVNREVSLGLARIVVPLLNLSTAIFLDED